MNLQSHSTSPTPSGGRGTAWRFLCAGVLLILLLWPIGCGRGADVPQPVGPRDGLAVLQLVPLAVEFGSKPGGFYFVGTVNDVAQLTEDYRLRLTITDQWESSSWTTDLETAFATVPGDSFFDRHTGYFEINGLTDFAVVEGWRTFHVELYNQEEEEIQDSWEEEAYIAPVTSPTSFRVRSARVDYGRRLGAALSSYSQGIAAAGLTFDETDFPEADTDEYVLASLINAVQNYCLGESRASGIMAFEISLEELGSFLIANGVSNEAYYEALSANVSTLLTQLRASRDAEAFRQFTTRSYAEGGELTRLNQIALRYYQGTHFQTDWDSLGGGIYTWTFVVDTDTGRPNPYETESYEEYDDAEFIPESVDWVAPEFALTVTLTDTDADDQIELIEFEGIATQDRRTELAPVPIAEAPIALWDTDAHGHHITPLRFLFEGRSFWAGR